MKDAIEAPVTGAVERFGVIASARLEWLDYAKGIGIVLVVYGHLLSSGFNSGLPIARHFFLLSDSVLYSFHMPLFFFLAGLVVERSYDNRSGRQFVLEKVTHLLRPYLIWSFAQTAAELLFSYSQHSADSRALLALPYLPRGQFWFLYALLWMYLTYAAFRMLKLPTAVMWMLAPALYFVHIDTPVFALDDFSNDLLFFVIGVTLSARLRRERRSIPLHVTLFVTAAFALAAAWSFDVAIPPARLSEDPTSHPCYFLGLSTLGVTMCVGWSQFLARSRLLPFFKTLGSYSMPIFLAHMLVGVAARVVLGMLGVEQPLINMSLSILTALLLPIVMYRICDRLRLRFVFA